MTQNNTFVVVERNLKYRLSLHLWPTRLGFFFFVVVVRLQNTQLVLGAGRSLLIVLCQLRQVSIIAGEHADTRGTTPARVKIVSNSDNVC